MTEQVKKYGRSEVVFILLLLLTMLPLVSPAMALNTFFDLPGQLTGGIVFLAKRGLVTTLFLIGTGMSLSVLREVGVRPLILGVLLWLLIGIGSLRAILSL